MILLNILVFIFVFGLIVLIHEAGHFYFAKKAGILCHEFSIGMGPALYKKKIGETTYCVRAIPIGGYVSMAGEAITDQLVKVGSTIGLNLSSGCVKEIVFDPNLDSQITGKVVECNLYGEFGEQLQITLEVNEQTTTYPVLADAFYVFDAKQRLQITPYERSFESKSLWKRFLTIFAGPFMNFVLCILLYFIYWCVAGIPNYQSTVIKTVVENNPAALAGVQAGDEIKSINGVSVDSWTAFSNQLDEAAKNCQDTIVLGVLRNGETITYNINPSIAIQSVGITNYNILEEYKNLPFPENITNGVMVGTVAPNYSEKVSGTSGVLSNGDIITGVKVSYSEKVNGKYVFTPMNNGEYIDVTSWSDLMKIFKDLDATQVHYRFYDQETSKMVESGLVEGYGNEILDAQNVAKLSVKVGVTVDTHFDLFSVIGYTFRSFWSDFTYIFRTLKLLISPSGVRQVGIGDLSGVVGIFDMIRTFMSRGFLPLVSFVAMLSVNIGIMNLLPIPALDGGRLVFLAYEGITKKKPNRKLEAALNNIVFILLMLLFVYVTFNDILRLF